MATVLPLCKNDDVSSGTNCRPVSLLSSTFKIFECIVFKYVYNYFNDNFMISLWQAGFFPGYYTILELIQVYHKFY